MKEHCHPCDMIFIIFWGKGTLQMETLGCRERDIQLDQRKMVLIMGAFLHQEHPTINRVTSSQPKADKQDKQKHSSSARITAGFLKVVSLPTPLLGSLLPPGGAMCHDKDNFCPGSSIHYVQLTSTCIFIQR